MPKSTTAAATSNDQHSRQASVMAMRRYYAKNRDKELQRFKAYYQKNKEKIRAYKKRVREQNKQRTGLASDVATPTTAMSIDFLCSKQQIVPPTTTVSSEKYTKLAVAFLLN
ncbi:unnamed protein product [Aphanomyces euteiches]|uniref:Uncharacterized protein n=1 Tax=Aphanomyces euteiches TaxID=100861 RepID=A0A6G0WII8_9STRA|nr:hypothetical protein Ae201684_014876 [Aphanomyces euteiches]KAH9072733.1 hypothetical protein Ae201684P_015804 [Aphanomyces euteiches]KAH9139460.1 hypothetical protein AeRB84_016269 [Aphanomyces euteiches]